MGYIFHLFIKNNYLSNLTRFDISSSVINSFSLPIYSSILSYKCFLPLLLMLFLKLNMLLIICPSQIFRSFNCTRSSLRPSFIFLIYLQPLIFSAFSSFTFCAAKINAWHSLSYISNTFTLVIKYLSCFAKAFFFFVISQK